MLKHQATVTRWDAIVAFWLTSGLLSPLFMSIHLAFSIYWVFFDSVWMQTYSSPIELVIIGVLGVLFYLALFQLVIFVLAVLIVTLNPRLKRGFLGAHTFEIRDDAFIESTAYNETHHKWPALDRIRRVLGRTFVRVGGSNWHVIPDRDFADMAAANAFVDAIKARADA